MPSLKTESFANSIATDGNYSEKSKIKILMDCLISNEVDNLNSILSLRNNFRMAERGTDLMNCFQDKEVYRTILEEMGYQETTDSKYTYENLNYLEGTQKINFVKDVESPFVTSIDINSKGVTSNLTYFTEENYLIFYSENERVVKYFYNFSDAITLLDVKIDKESFVHILFKEDEKVFLGITHLAKNFAALNDKNGSEFSYDHFYNLIDLNGLEVNTILNTDYSSWFLLNKNNNNIYRVDFTKRYFFASGSNIYFNLTKDIEKHAKDFLEDEDIQVEHLSLYDKINFLGLNSFKAVDGRKFSTLETDDFKKIIKFKFDNTINGGLNFFNRMNYQEYQVDDTDTFLQGVLSNKEKDYAVNIDDDFFCINGNFHNKFKNGKYKITIEIPNYVDGLSNQYFQCSLYKFDERRKKFVFEFKHTVNVNSGFFYFCNLKCFFKKISYGSRTFDYLISAEDAYTYVSMVNQNCDIKEFPDSDNILKNRFAYGVLNYTSNFNIMADFNGKGISFYNYFDYNKMSFAFSSTCTELTKPGESLQMTSGFQYRVFGDYIIKNERIYNRGKTNVYYTNKSNEHYNLINDAGYITNFWIENSGKVISFKIVTNGIEISETSSNADFSCYIPLLEELLSYTGNQYGTVTIIDNDYYEVNAQYSENILITSKFFNQPLFYKFLIPDDGTFELYDSTGKIITERISESYGDQTVVYFAPDRKQLYYYVTSSEEQSYISPIKAFENFEDNYDFDESGNCSFTRFKVNNIKLNSINIVNEDDVFEVFIYDDENSSVSKIELNGAEFNTSINLEVYANRFSISSANDNYNLSDFYILEYSDDSLLIDDTITFYKTDKGDTVYLSYEETAMEFEDIPLKKVRVGITHSYAGGDVFEDSCGSFYFRKLLQSEIAIRKHFSVEGSTHKIEKFISIGKSDFYENNFKTPGLNYIGNTVEFKKAIETFNTTIISKNII
jgi:hypothetical protein